MDAGARELAQDAPLSEEERDCNACLKMGVTSNNYGVQVATFREIY